MYAAMMKSQNSQGELRTVAITPTADGNVRIFSRLGEGRGRAGAWVEGDVLIEDNEMLVGSPVSLKITPAEDRIINSTITPSMFLVKLGKKLTASNVTSNSALDEFNTLVEQTMNDPSSLAVYENAVVQVTQATPQPVVQQVVATPPQPDPQVQEIELPIQETPMQYTNSSVLSSDNETPITVPAGRLHIERVFDGVLESQVFDFARDNQRTVLLTGPAGTGKSSAAEHYAHIRNIPFVVVECTQQIDQTVLHGRFVPTGVGNSTKWKYSQFATAIQQPSVILINELSRLQPKAASLLLRVLNERELIVDQLNQVIKVHPECLFIADQNTGQGYTGVQRQDDALYDRMQPKLEFDYDIELESKFIPSSALLQFAHSIREASKTTDQFSKPMSTRILLNFIEQAKGLNLSFAVSSMLNNFPKDDGEREAIKMTFDANVDVIAQELGVPLNGYNE
jgi:hypothetical protein